MTKQTSHGKTNGETPPENRSEREPPDITATPAARTLRGDIRDRVLAEFKSLPKPWQQMTEAEQRRTIEVATNIAETVVHQAVAIAAHEGAPHLVAEVSQFTVKDGLKVQMMAAGTVENITRLADHRGAAVIVLVDPSKYRGERKKAEPDVVGDLRLPKAHDDGPEEREDEAHLQHIGRGKPPAEAKPLPG